MTEYDNVVVGAGPAGLAFASTIKNESTLVVDLGKPCDKRNRFDSQDCVQGAGGAGLFSDGKFSFFPAGTKIWEGARQSLRVAYKQLEEELSPFACVPAFPDLDNRHVCIEDQAGWVLKPYPSIYLSLQNRMTLIKTLSDRCPYILYQTEFLAYKPEDDGYRILLKHFPTSMELQLKVKNIILAGGRFFPLCFQGPKTFRRVEFGIRIVAPHHLIQKDVDLIDPKYMFKKGEVEYRTFCWCVRGEVVKTCLNGIETYSGRADCQPTHESNFGFNIRIKSPSLLSPNDFNALLKMKSFTYDLKTFLKKYPDIYPESTIELIRYGLGKLLDRFTHLVNEKTRVMGPTIEGVGEYPHIDHDFRLHGEQGVFVVGDSSGMYRGIIPSMLSGYTLAVIENENRKENHLSEIQVAS